MNIRITDKILSIPPYISTHWSRIAALHMKGSMLAITLVDGDTLHIPHLNEETIHLIFQQHASHLEKEQLMLPKESSDAPQLKEMMEGEPAIRFAFGTSFDGLGGMMQHNPAQADAPDLPPEILQKIGAIAKILAPAEEQELLLPKAESNCNCFYCQVARVLNPTSPSTPVAEELEVADEELHFQQWSITQTGEQLFLVVNCLDEHEKYNVFLGQPVGCTCGKQGCEHILAVLKS